jgi:hypothetical protein
MISTQHCVDRVYVTGEFRKCLDLGHLTMYQRGQWQPFVWTPGLIWTEPALIGKALAGQAAKLGNHASDTRADEWIDEHE